MDKVSESLLKRFLDASNLTGPDAAVCTGAAVFVPLYWWYLGDDMKTKRNFVHSILNLLIFFCPLGKVLIMCFRGFQDSWLYELVIVVVSFTPALIKWLTSSARPAPTRGPTDPDNGKKTSGSTSTESVEQPGRGGGANGLQEKTDHGGRGHPGMLEQPTTVDGGAQDTNLPLSDLHKRAEEKATQEELRDVAKEVQAVWPDFATHLDPYMFTAAGISVIRRNSGLHPSEFMCAKVMLEKWAQNQDRKATRRRLIKAMYDNDLIPEARKVFETTHKYHGLVEYVLKSTGGK